MILCTVAETLCKFFSSFIFLFFFHIRDFCHILTHCVVRSQFIHRLNEAGVLRLSDDAATSIFSQFNIRFNDDVPDTPVPVTYAVFARKYEHLRVEGVKYRGKREYPTLEN